MGGSPTPRALMRDSTAESMPSLTIGVVPRERFCLTAETIRRIVANTSAPYRLIVVDAATPDRYRSQFERALPVDRSVQLLRFDRHLLPNESRNRIVAATEDEFLCLIDNDVLVEPGWLEPLVAACEAESAGVARPVVLKSGDVHFDRGLGPLSTALGTPGCRAQIGGRSRPSEFDPQEGRRQVDWLEMHCLLFRRSVFSVIGPLDEALSTREHLDLSLALRSRGIPIVFEPESRVHFVPPPPVHPDERPFFFFRWDVDKAIASNARVRTKWNLSRYRSNVDWVLARRSRVDRAGGFLAEMRERLAPVRSFPRRVERAVNERRKRLDRSAAQRRFGILPGLEAGSLRNVLCEEDTRFIRAGSVTFGVERRLPRDKDVGVSLHVFTEHGEDGRLERFRIDCLLESPHYHYVFQDQGIHQKFWIDPLVVEDTQAWALDLIRRRLPQILMTVGGAYTAALADMAEIERVLPEVESAMVQATDWTVDFPRA
jgi:Glycosyl transferase family 2